MYPTRYPRSLNRKENMGVVTLKPNFSDERGTITDVLDNQLIDSLTMLDTKKGSIRANHYHKQTIQYIYVVSGKLRYVSKAPDKEAVETIVNPGDLVTSNIMEQHAFEALEDSLLVCAAKGPRRGSDYERDTFRLMGDDRLIK